MNELKVINKPQKCHFCNVKENDIIKFGPLYKLGEVRAHYFCVLLSHNLIQNGSDEEGMLGFLLEDIRQELHRSSTIICSYCGKKNASIICCFKKCSTRFHLPCGLKNGSLHQFMNQFKSFCRNHRPTQKIPIRIFKDAIENVTICCICYERVEVTRKMEDVLWAPCCRKTWYHKYCVQKLAHSAGYFFKCAACNDSEKFKAKMERFGIYVPQQDASWERVPNAFAELLHRHDTCDAEVCKCPDGRQKDEERTVFEIVLCRCCGAQGVHILCGGLSLNNPDWECNVCKAVVTRSRGLNLSPKSAREMKESLLKKAGKSSSGPVNEAWPPFAEEGASESTRAETTSTDEIVVDESEKGESSESEKDEEGETLEGKTTEDNECAEEEDKRNAEESLIIVEEENEEERGPSELNEKEEDRIMEEEEENHKAEESVLIIDVVKGDEEEESGVPIKEKKIREERETESSITKEQEKCQLGVGTEEGGKKKEEKAAKRMEQQEQGEAEESVLILEEIESEEDRESGELTGKDDSAEEQKEEEERLEEDEEVVVEEEIEEEEENVEDEIIEEQEEELEEGTPEGDVMEEQGQEEEEEEEAALEGEIMEEEEEEEALEGVIMEEEVRTVEGQEEVSLLRPSMESSPVKRISKRQRSFEDFESSALGKRRRVVKTCAACRKERGWTEEEEEEEGFEEYEEEEGYEDYEEQYDVEDEEEREEVEVEEDEDELVVDFVSLSGKFRDAATQTESTEEDSERKRRSEEEKKKKDGGLQEEKAGEGSEGVEKDPGGPGPSKGPDIREVEPLARERKKERERSDEMMGGDGGDWETVI